MVAELHPDIRRWPLEAVDFYRERSAIVWADTRCAPEDADRAAETITRAWWRRRAPPA